MIILQLINVDKSVKPHVIDKYLNWESAAKNLAEMINDDTIDTDNHFIKFVDEGFPLDS